MPCCERVKRPQNSSPTKASSPRSGEELASNRRPRLLNEQVALNGKVCCFQQQAASVFTARAAAHHHIRLFLLASQPGGLAIVPARGRVRPVVGIPRPSKPSGTVPPTPLFQPTAAAPHPPYPR